MVVAVAALAGAAGVEDMAAEGAAATAAAAIGTAMAAVGATKELRYAPMRAADTISRPTFGKACP
jgi:hypothetical protein